MTVLLLLHGNKLLYSTPESFTTTARYADYTMPDVHATSLFKEIAVSVCTALPLVLDELSIRTAVPMVFGCPSHWPVKEQQMLQKALQECSKVSVVVIVETSLLSAYGCARGNAVVIELLDSVCVVSFIQDFSFNRMLSSVCSDGDLDACVGGLLQLTDADRRPVLFDNIILTGPKYTAASESAVMAKLHNLLSTSPYAAEHQVKTTSVRRVPEYHVEIYKALSGDVLQAVCGLLGAAIAAKTIIAEHRA